MYYRKALREAGYNPDDIRDAKKRDEFILHIGPRELRGSVIGHPMKCAGARGCVKQQGAEFAWVGANVAILGFPGGKLIRYKHNGQLTAGHDAGMFAVGDYKFKAVPEGDMIRSEARKQNKTIRSRHEGKGIRNGIVFKPEPGLAAQMRRGWEVEAAG